MTYPTLITFDQALAHLREPRANDGSPSEWDADLQRKIEEATAIVIDYIMRPDPVWQATIASWDLSQPGSPATSAPPAVVAAVFRQLSDLFCNRGDYAEAGGTPGALAPGVANLLYRYRDPVVA